MFVTLLVLSKKNKTQLITYNEVCMRYFNLCGIQKSAWDTIYKKSAVEIEGDGG